MSAITEVPLRMLQRQHERLVAEVNDLCRRVDARPDVDVIYSSLPMWDGELSGQEPSTADLVRMRDYLVERLDRPAGSSQSGGAL